MNTDNRLQRFKILSGSGLKIVAVVTMLIDHLALYLWRVDPDMWEPLFTIGHHTLTPYLLLRGIGRLAFPIFAFLIVEGYQHTRDRWRYGRNLLVFALLSELPWNLVHTGTWHYSHQNVFFTLFLGYLGICVIEHYRTYWSRYVLSFWHCWLRVSCCVPTMEPRGSASSCWSTCCATVGCCRPS
ncbi:MAG: hypothetical protein IJ546_09510 [Prevotella sp.]|nr:hypothetical protein [Prevotella sp.]